MQLDLRSRREPEVGVLNLEKVRGKFRELAGAHQRSGVDKKRGQNFRVAMLACVHIQKEIGEGALQASAPTLVDCKARAGNFRGDGEVEYSGALPDFPVRLGHKIEFRRRAPAAHFDIVGGAVAHRHAGVRDIGDRQQQFTLCGVELRDAFVTLLDALGNLLHLREQRVRILLFLLQSRDFLASFISLSLELLGRGDQFAALFVEHAKRVKIESRAAFCGHLGKQI